MENFLHEIIRTIGEILIPMVLAIGVGFFKRGIDKQTAHLEAKTDNEHTKKAIEAFSTLAKVVVGEVGQTMAEGMKKATADGKLNKDDAVILKNVARDKLVAMSPAWVKTSVGTITESLGDYAESEIERQIGKMKAKAAK